jgi:FlaA1/EpsC-like NDP-sugar epimerase
LLTFVAGFRISFRIFNSYYKRSFGNRGKKILIYGAGYRGSTVLKEIRNNEAYSYSPAGFIDDAPEKIGKKMSGVPVLGSIDDLDNILKENQIAEIIVSTAKIGRDKIKKLIELCEQKGIIARLFEFRFYEFP